VISLQDISTKEWQTVMATNNKKTSMTQTFEDAQEAYKLHWNNAAFGNVNIMTLWKCDKIM